jgi:GntR family transcriptional repressor for pyruvate dehydrogenase complex
MNVLVNFQAIELESPIDITIKLIRNLIVVGQSKSGEKRPSERKFSESFGIGRTYVRDAIKKLEFYVILKTLPQSETVVSGVNISAKEGLISNLIQLNKNDFFHSVETRIIMEMYARSRAVVQRSTDTKYIIKTSIVHLIKEMKRPYFTK